jgi:predicted deacetylase
MIRSPVVTPPSSSAPSPGGRWLVVSFHDLAPHSQRPCQELLLQLAELGVPRASLLVVPRWHEMESIRDRPFFHRWLLSLTAAGHEVCLHGLTHRAARGEFRRIDGERAEVKVQEGAELLSGLGCPARGFVPPGWRLSPAAREVLRRRGFVYTATLRHLDLLQENRRIAAPAVAFDARNIWRRVVSPLVGRLRFAASRQAPILRIAVHPGDLYEPAIRRTLVALLRESLADRVPVTYGELADRVASGAAAS